MWILIDNYDSFTHILHHYLLQLHDAVMVFRNDAITLDELMELNPERIIISPGPQTPMEAGITNDVVRHFANKIPLLGICLGHQALGVYFGATLNKANRPVHGNTSTIIHQNDALFNNIPERFEAMRYHSLIIENFADTDIIPLAFSEEGELMVFKHKTYQATGIQFHPESILTENGLQLLRNWKEMYPCPATAGYFN